MAKEGKLTAELRDKAGSAHARRMRRQGWVPASIHDEKGQAESIRLRSHEVELLMLRTGSANLLVDVEIPGRAPEKVLMREVQTDPLSGALLHLDLNKVSMTRKMRIHIPIELVGDPEGVTDGGILDHSLRALEVECLPGDMVDKIVVDVSALKIGSSLLVGQLKVDPRLTVLTPASVSVASVVAPRTEEEKAPTEEAAAAEPEVIGKKAEEGEEGAEGKEAKEGKEGKEAKEKEAKEPKGKEPKGKESKGKEPKGKAGSEK